MPDEFTEVIRSIIYALETDPDNFVSTIVSPLYSMDKHLKKIHAEEIDYILVRIRCLNGPIVTKRTKTKLKRILYMIYTRSSLDLPWKDDSNTVQHKGKANHQGSVNSLTNNINQLCITKLTDDDLIESVILNLISDLSRNMLSSGFTNVVLEYQQTVQQILLDEYSQKYKPVITEVHNCLLKNGWKETGGFSHPPNCVDLLEDLGKIVDKYF